MWANVIVLVQQSIQTQIIQDIPTKLLASMVAGQRVEAIVVASTTAAEMASIKVADTILNIRSSLALLAGQKVQLEMMVENGKPILKLVSLDNVKLPELIEIKPGQPLAVEVIKVLAKNRVLVQVSNLIGNNQAPLPSKQLDVDISQLTHRHKVGDKLIMDVISVKPLSVQFRPEPLKLREQIILEKISQLLPQQSNAPTLSKVMTSFHNQKLPEPVQKAVQQLIQQSVERSDLTKTQVFKQALASSGVVMERQLLNQPSQKTQDFKANLLNILKAVETVITDSKGQSNNKAINQLPAQVQAALAVNGKTPAQLLSILLSGKGVPSLLSSLNTQANLPSNISQQQVASLVALLNKPLLLSQQVAARNAPMDLIELMQLFKEVENVHNKIQLNQLNMLKEPEPSSTVASWLFDLPIKDKQALDLLQVQIDQHKSASEEDEGDIWNVKIRLDTQNLGPVQATVTLHDQDVKVIIRAEKQESAQLLEDNLMVLNEMLDKIGVSISHSSCCCGAVDKAVNLKTDPVKKSDGLLDVLV